MKTGYEISESESHSVVSDSLRPHRLCSPRNSPGQNTGVGSLSLLWGIFPTQGLNPGLPHCRQILYKLSHKESTRIMVWVAYPFSSRSSRPRNQTRVSCMQADSLPTELPGKPLYKEGKWILIGWCCERVIWALEEFPSWPLGASQGHVPIKHGRIQNS